MPIAPATCRRTGADARVLLMLRLAGYTAVDDDEIRAAVMAVG